MSQAGTILIVSAAVADQCTHCLIVISFLLSACGRAAKKHRIMGGDASPGSWPWHAFIVTYGPNGFTQCGGSLITNQWVLTAAQCITSSNYRTEVHLGGYNQSALNPNEVTLKVADTICHPAYNYLTHGNDICLLKLSAPVNFTDYIQPICLASKNSTFHNGTSSWVTGYTDYYAHANVLQEANLPILGNNECSCYYQNYYYYYYYYYYSWLPKITENITCTQSKYEQKGPCYKDEGEPLMTKAGSVWVQSGIVSYSFCGGPSLYTRVSQYQKWISDTVTGTPPGFVTFTSPGTDSDLNFTCPTSPPFTSPSSFPTDFTTDFTDVLVTDDSVFDSGENLIHFTHLTSLCILVVLLHVFAGNGI
uniref:Peptidase S1 domain-containing protein n=1 Tax=Amphilophus citrinellus TaxID=61819 RepID=A0A3Q0R343_AMPCI